MCIDRSLPRSRVLLRSDTLPHGSGKEGEGNDGASVQRGSRHGGGEVAVVPPPRGPCGEAGDAGSADPAEEGRSRGGVRRGSHGCV